MPGLPATGELTYNGYTFDGATHIDVETQFLYDDADRVVTGHRYTIRVSAIVHDDNGLDQDLESIRQAGRGWRITDL